MATATTCPYLSTFAVLDVFASEKVFSRVWVRGDDDVRRREFEGRQQWWKCLMG
jgi:hypothetical protein